MVADVNGVHFERFSWIQQFRQSTGSTAYNKSLRKVLLTFTIEALQLTEIKSNNVVLSNAVCPLLFLKRDKIELIPTRNDYHTFLYFD